MAKLLPATMNAASPFLPPLSKPSSKKLSSRPPSSSPRTQKKTPAIVPSFFSLPFFHSSPMAMAPMEMMMPMPIPAAPTTTTAALDAAIGHSFEGARKRRRPTTAASTTTMTTPLPSLFIFVIGFVLAILAVSAEGYNIDRLYNGNAGLSEAQQMAMLRQFQNADELWRSTKKSPEFNAAKLTKFNGNGSRNCFFTPIQCMLQHDVNKLRRMVDPADIGQAS